MASWFHSLFAGLLQRRLGSRHSPHGDGRGCVTAECAAILVRPPVWRVSMPVPALRRTERAEEKRRRDAITKAEKQVEQAEHRLQDARAEVERRERDLDAARKRLEDARRRYSGVT